MRLLCAAVACVASILVLTGHAAAHPLTPAFLEVEERADGRLAVTWKTTLSQLPGVVLKPQLPAGCLAEGNPTQTLCGTAVVEHWSARCGESGLAGHEIAIDGLRDSKTDALLRVALADGRTVQAILRPDAPSLVVPVQPTKLGVLRDYGRLGIEHILTGPDHLLFVLGLLLLVAGPLMLLKTVTAFTVGHSITLSLAVLGLAKLPPDPIEIGIAASVLLLAVELTRRDAARASLMRRLPWLLAGLFGLLHGLGFAGALSEVGLPEGEIPLALAAFNLGIEIGQLVFVAAVVTLAEGLRRAAGVRPAWLELGSAYVMGSLAAMWCIERSVAMLFGR